jgi:hypothetical protein
MMKHSASRSGRANRHFRIRGSLTLGNPPRTSSLIWDRVREMRYLKDPAAARVTFMAIGSK